MTAKVRLVRLQTRGGLVRTRMAGIRAARGEVLTFLDSHIEATHGWLEPLLDRWEAESTKNQDLKYHHNIQGRPQSSDGGEPSYRDN